MNEAQLVLFEGARDYRFCTPAWRAHRAVPLDQLLSQLGAIHAASCRRLVITGDSPLDHPDFVALARECGRLGFEHLALETDAAPLARRGMVTLLGRLGFTQLVVAMGGLHESVHDAVLQQPGTLRAALEGLQRAVAHAASGGPRVYMTVPLLRANVDDLEALLDWAIALPGKLQGVLLSLPEIARVPDAYRDQLLPYATQAQVGGASVPAMSGAQRRVRFRQQARRPPLRRRRRARALRHRLLRSHPVPAAPRRRAPRRAVRARRCLRPRAR